MYPFNFHYFDDHVVHSFLVSDFFTFSILLWFCPMENFSILSKLLNRCGLFYVNILFFLDKPENSYTIIIKMKGRSESQQESV